MLALIGACLALVVLAGCGSSNKSVSTSGAAGSTAATAGSGATAAVAYRGIAIAPVNVTVHKGQTIRWTNFDGTPHNVTATGGVAKFASKDFGKGGTYEYRADKVGVIDYVCTIHPASMVGKVTVVQ